MALNVETPAREVLGAAVDALRAAGCDSPRLDAELLLAEALGVDRARLVADPAAGVDPAAARQMMGWVRRRVMREPAAYILGRKGFRRLDLEVDSRVLVPRPDTELLVEVALELPQGARVHDVGTGSGAIALALKDERPDLIVSGSDVSPAAVEVAQSNAARLGLDVTFAVGPGLREADADLVVANLPYVREDEWANLAPEITRWEPRGALVAGGDGLDAIRALVDDAPPGLCVALEHSPDQGEAVRTLLRGASTRRDLGGRERVTSGSAP